MPDEEQPFLVCAPVDGLANTIDGSIKQPCAHCEKIIWIAPSGQEIIRNHDALAICVPCAQKMAEGEEIVVAPVSPEQYEEIFAELWLEFDQKWRDNV